MFYRCDDRRLGGKYYVVVDFFISYLEHIGHVV